MRRRRSWWNCKRVCFQVTVKNDFSDEMFKSTWHYAKDIVNRETVKGTTTGYSNYDFHEKVDKTKVSKETVS